MCGVDEPQPSLSAQWEQVSLENATRGRRRESRVLVCLLPPLLPFALDSGVNAPFVVQRTFRSLLPLSPHSSGFCQDWPLLFHLCLIPIKSFQKGRQRWAGGGWGGGHGAETGRRQGRWVGGRPHTDKGWEARRQSRGWERESFSLERGSAQQSSGTRSPVGCSAWRIINACQGGGSDADPTGPIVAAFSFSIVKCKTHAEKYNKYYKAKSCVTTAQVKKSVPVLQSPWVPHRTPPSRPYCAPLHGIDQSCLILNFICVIRMPTCVFFCDLLLSLRVMFSKDISSRWRGQSWFSLLKSWGCKPRPAG